MAMETSALMFLRSGPQFDVDMENMFYTIEDTPGTQFDSLWTPAGKPDLIEIRDSQKLPAMTSAFKTTDTNARLLAHIEILRYDLPDELLSSREKQTKYCVQKEVEALGVDFPVTELHSVARILASDILRAGGVALVYGETLGVLHALTEYDKTQ